MEKKWTERIFFTFLAILAVLLLVFVFMGRNVKNVGFFEKYNVQSIIRDWYWYDNDTGESHSIYLPGEFDVKAGETFTIKRILDNVIDGEVLCFRTEHTSVRVLIDGEEIYSFGWKENIPLGKSPGSIWNVIELKKEYKSKPLTIEYNCPYDKYSGKVTDIIRGQSGDVYLYILEDSLPSLIMNMIPLVLGIVLVLAFAIGGKQFKMKSLLFLGIYLVVNALWGLSESRFLQFQYGNPFALHMLNFITFVSVPLCTVMTLQSVNIIKDHLKTVYGIVFGCTALVVILQLFGIKDFFETIELVHLAIFCGCGIICYDNYMQFKYKKLKGFGYIFASFVALFASLVFDMVVFYTFGWQENGYFFRMGAIIFVMILGVWAIKQALHSQRKTAEREAVVKMAYTDNLTGLLNRRSFDDDLSELEKEKVKAVIVMIDLNNLKLINDNFGHQSGDTAIKAISSRLKVFTDKYNEKCFRTGGDEFCVICRHITVNEVISICERINDELNKSNEVPGARLSMAYGYKVYEPHSIDSVEQVVKQADEQMYIKKQKMKQEMAMQKANEN